MTIDEARIVLDRIRNGLWEPDRQIKEALFVCGDLRPDRESHSESCYVTPYHRTREMANQGAYERQFGPLWKHSNGCESED